MNMATISSPHKSEEMFQGAEGEPPSVDNISPAFLALHYLYLPYTMSLQLLEYIY